MMLPYVHGPNQGLAKDGERVATFQSVASLGTFSVLVRGVLASFG